MKQGNQDDMPQQGETMETIAASPPEQAAERGPKGQGGGNVTGKAPSEEEGMVAGSPEEAASPEADADTGGEEEHPPHEPHHQWARQPLPPGYAVDPATGQIVFVGAVYQQPASQPPFQHGVQPPPGVVYVQAETPEQAAARQAMEQQRHGQIVHSFEQFMQGEATVSDVVKTLYTNTAQYDQLWKGALVGAAATILLTSKPVREAMGKTFGSVFPGLKPQHKTAGASPAAVDPLTSGKE